MRIPKPRVSSLLFVLTRRQEVRVEDNRESDHEYVEEEQAPSYELSLTGPGMTIARTVDQNTALGVITLLMEGTPAAAASRSVPLIPGRPSAGVTMPRTASPGSHTVGEFLSEVGAKRNPDRIVAFGVYLEDYVGKRPFTRDDIRSQFGRAGEPMPGNFARDFGWAISNRWIAEVDGSKDKFFVTNTGHKALEAKFSDEFIKKTKRLDRRRRTKAKGTAKEQEAGSEAE
jgi:hypothetical protein